MQPYIKTAHCKYHNKLAPTRVLEHNILVYEKHQEQYIVCLQQNPYGTAITVGYQVTRLNI